MIREFFGAFLALLGLMFYGLLLLIVYVFPFAFLIGLIYLLVGK